VQAQTERDDSLTVVNLLVAVPSQNVVEIFCPVAFMNSLSIDLIQSSAMTGMKVRL